LEAENFGGDCRCRFVPGYLAHSAVYPSGFIANFKGAFGHFEIGKNT
jgi:hypothetical protein